MELFTVRYNEKVRKNISTYSKSEKKVGYSRAVITGNKIHTSGTTAMDEYGKIFGNNVYEQTVYIFNKLKAVLEKGGFSEKDVVTTTVYLVNMKQLPDFDRAFNERFSEINPTCTLVGVNALVEADLLIEVEYFAEKEL